MKLDGRRKAGNRISKDTIWILTNTMEYAQYCSELINKAGSLFTIKIEYHDCDIYRLVTFAVERNKIPDTNQIWCLFDCFDAKYDENYKSAKELAQNFEIGLAYSCSTFKEPLKRRLEEAGKKSTRGMPFVPNELFFKQQAAIERKNIMQFWNNPSIFRLIESLELKK